jgi:Glycosyltransferase
MDFQQLSRNHNGMDTIGYKQDISVFRDELQKARVNYAINFAELKKRRELEARSRNSGINAVKTKLSQVKNKLYQVLTTTKQRQRQEQLHPPQQVTFNHHPYHIKLNVTESANRKRVLHAIPTFSTGGSQQLVVDIIENLSDEYEHFVIIARKRGPLGYIGIPIELMDVHSVNCAQDISQHLQLIQPHFVHIHFWATTENVTDWYWYHLVFQEVFKLRIPVIQNCNNPTFPYFDKQIIHNVFVSNYAKSVFGLSAPNCTVVYPGSNFDKFKSDEGYVPGQTVGMVYRLEKDKLNEQSIEPFIETIKKRPGTRALIVGGGTLYNTYKRRVEEEGLSAAFEFTGYVPYDELPAYYKRISIFVAPVHQESFGQVTPFAMNMGIPVAGYNIGALPEILADQTLLAEPGNSDQLSDILVNLLDDKHRMKKISEFNKERAGKYFSLETMISAYREIYRTIL